MVQNGSELTLVKPISLKVKQAGGKPLSRKQEMVARLAARGLDPKTIGEEVGLTPKRVRQVLRMEGVVTETARITAEIFQEGDRHLVMLYKKALAKLDEHMDNPNVDIQSRAIERVLKFYERKDERGRPLVAQFFAGTHAPQEEREESLDEIVLRKRRERGLPND